MRLSNYIKENYAIIPFWIMLFLILWLQAIPQTESLLEATLFSICVLLASFPFSAYLSEDLLQKAMKKRKIGKFIIQFIAISFLVGYVFFGGFLYLFHILEQRGIFPVSTYFDMVNLPPYSFLVLGSSGIAVNTCICGARFFQENMKLKKTLVEYQLQILQQQINPHFMFNVLNHIYILMKKDVDLASDLLTNYSEILRYQLYDGKKDYVKLGEELRFLKDFIEVEKIRWGNELKVDCKWNIEDEEAKIPPLMLITFVENAFKHVSRSISEKGYINIKVEQKGNKLYMEVENSKSVRQVKKKDSSGLGLVNIKKRLDILYPQKHTLFIEENELIYIIRLNLTL